MEGRPSQDPTWELLQASITRRRASVMALVFGLVGGMGLFVATLWLVIRGGERVGPHLGLLGQYFLGYSVTWSGCFVGFFYGALVGATAGWSVAWLYNRLADRRQGSAE